MIIKIEGLPNDRKIKHINVDISFEDGEPVVNASVDTISQPQPIAPRGTAETETTASEAPEAPEAPKPEIIEREKKEIPPEMLDMEF